MEMMDVLPRNEFNELTEPFCFFSSSADTPTSVYGNSLKQQVEDRLKFYESGETPRKNIDVMKEAMGLAAEEVPAATTNGVNGSAKKDKKKKDKKRKAADDQENNGAADLNGTANTTLNETNGDGDDDEPKKKKKKKKNKAE